MADEDRDNVLNKLLLNAARTDNVDQLLDEVFSKPGEFDINYQDGIGNTALHYAASVGSVEVLNELLEYEDCDVDYTNHLEGATPLHLAVKIKGPELRAFIVDSLLDAGADTRIKDKAGQVPLDYVLEDDTETRNAFRRHQAINSISAADVDDDDDEDEEYSESDEEE
ncbi:ankyrin repeat-containing domain protein [Russula ochroleuca]|uniref:Ankyrin repeat-containing domain protein n=1 Tax=Russula ochroleuca TaxID=152965 RepID=A0A9P5MYG5_9AGAM|nr:ankyrin repeat-containing domain protein [Russula ochroleuca]